MPEAKRKRHKRKTKLFRNPDAAPVNESIVNGLGVACCACGAVEKLP